jgi:hypothetical protein
LNLTLHEDQVRCRREFHPGQKGIPRTVGKWAYSSSWRILEIVVV